MTGVWTHKEWQEFADETKANLDNSRGGDRSMWHMIWRLSEEQRHRAMEEEYKLKRKATT